MPDRWRGNCSCASMKRIIPFYREPLEGRVWADAKGETEGLVELLPIESSRGDS